MLASTASTGAMMRTWRHAPSPPRCCCHSRRGRARRHARHVTWRRRTRAALPAEAHFDLMPACTGPGGATGRAAQRRTHQAAGGADRRRPSTVGSARLFSRTHPPPKTVSCRSTRGVQRPLFCKRHTPSLPHDDARWRRCQDSLPLSPHKNQDKSQPAANAKSDRTWLVRTGARPRAMLGGVSYALHFVHLLSLSCEAGSPVNQ